MAKYSDIKGFTVQTLSTDTAASQAAGGSWASGGTLNTGRNGVRGAGVSQTATVVFGGNDGSVTGKTENYNGSSWTETTDMNTGKTNSVGTGTYTAAIAAYTSTAETWDGSSWTEVSELNTSRQEIGSFGTQTAALAFGNQNGASAIVEQWNGSTWTEVADLNTAVGAPTGFGTTSAGHAVGGGDGSSPPQIQAINQIWNGSSWAEGADMNTARYFAAASGTTTAGLVFSGYSTTQLAITESWDGSTFTEQADLSTSRFTGAPAHNSTQADAILAGGNPGNKNVTEEWTAPAVFNQIQEGQLYFNSTANAFKETINDLTGGTWASGGALNNGRTGVSGARNTPGHGTGLAMAGFTTPPLTARGYTEEYNGTSWTEDTDMNTARGQTSGTGTSATAGIVYGGETYPPPVNKTDTETWNGSSWTEVNELNTAGRSMGNCGTTTAALSIAGTPAGDRAGKTEVWDGTSWTESGDVPSVPAGLSYNCAFGTTTAATTTGGGPGPAGYKRKAWSWTGSSWSETTENNSDKTGGMAFGSNADSGFAFVSSTTEFWNGTSWTEVNDQSTGKTEGGSGGVSDSGLAFGGPSNETATEEWTAGLSNKTITAS